jgi:ribonuclease P protein component
MASAMRQTFRPTERIRRRADYERVYARGRRLHGRFLTLFALPTEHGIARLGVAATRKLGGAVRRNRAKRLVREMYRQHKPGPGLDVVIVPRKEALEQAFSVVVADYAGLVGRLSRAVRRDRREGS